jgi:hypothetical protein
LRPAPGTKMNASPALHLLSHSDNHAVKLWPIYGCGTVDRQYGTALVILLIQGSAKPHFIPLWRPNLHLMNNYLH